MHTVVETPAFQKSATQAGMSEIEIVQLIDYLAANPDVGDEIKGTGGCRKIRVAGRGKGKSGGYRVITFYSGSAIPVFLFYAYSKSDRDDLDGKQRNALKNVTKEIVQTYGRDRPVRRVK
jgi:hypothetical protein